MSAVKEQSMGTVSATFRVYGYTAPYLPGEMVLPEIFRRHGLDVGRLPSTRCGASPMYGEPEPGIVLWGEGKRTDQWVSWQAFYEGVRAELEHYERNPAIWRVELSLREQVVVGYAFPEEPS